MSQLAISPGPEALALMSSVFTTRGHPDPHPPLRRLRELGPVHRTPLGAVVLDADGCATVLRDERFAPASFDLDPRAETSAYMRSGRRWLISADGGWHQELRAMFTSVLAPARLQDLGRLAAASVERWLPDLPRGGEQDIAGSLAQPLPLTIAGELIGIPAQDRGAFGEWAAVLQRVNFDPWPPDADLAAADAAILASEVHLRGLLRRRRANARENLLGCFAAAVRARRIEEEDAVANLQLALMASFSTTALGIGNACLDLLRHPDQLKALRDVSGRLRGAITELLRHEPPLLWTPRVTRQAVELPGGELAAGVSVLAVIAAANRDPLRTPDPDRLDITRPPARAITFGRGVHVCLGAALARLELTAAIGGLLRRYRTLELAQPDVDWVPSTGLRGPRSLPVWCRS